MAYSILASCRKIAIKESMNLLSDVRLGSFAELSGLPKLPMPIYKIMIDIQPGHLHIDSGRIMDEAETDIARADYLRSIFNSL